MPVKLEDRPIDQVREEVVDVLIHNFSHGVISKEAFERRLDIVIESTLHQEIVEQINDLEKPNPDAVKMQNEPTFTGNYQHKVSPHEDSKKQERLFTILSESNRSGIWSVPKTTSVFCLLGEATIDLTDARFTHPHSVIKVYSLLGTTKVQVPENLNVTCKAVNFLASTSNKAPCFNAEHSPVIEVQGVLILSELSIKIRRTMKESFMEFAQKMKLLFEEKKT